METSRNWQNIFLKKKTSFFLSLFFIGKKYREKIDINKYYPVKKIERERTCKKSVPGDSNFFMRSVRQDKDKKKELRKSWFFSLRNSVQEGRLTRPDSRHAKYGTYFLTLLSYYNVSLPNQQCNERKEYFDTVLNTLL